MGNSLVALLQSVTDTNKLSSNDVISRLMQEYCHLTGADAAADSALLAKNTGVKSSFTASGSKKRCRYCRYCRHVKNDCQKKQHHLASKSRKKTSHAPSVASSQQSDDSSDNGSVSTSEHAKIASSLRPRSKRSRQWEDGELHVF